MWGIGCMQARISSKCFYTEDKHLLIEGKQKKQIRILLPLKQPHAQELRRP